MSVHIIMDTILILTVSVQLQGGNDDYMDYESEGTSVMHNAHHDGYNTFINSQ